MSDDMKDDEFREQSAGTQLGFNRYQRYCAAFDHMERALAMGYPLEAIAILDSLIGDRLASRLRHLQAAPIVSRLTIGQLASKLLDPPRKDVAPREANREFRDATLKIRAWVKQRNKAMHSMAKIIQDDHSPRRFDELLTDQHSVVDEGIALLREYDALDTADRAKVNKIPATRPHAFFPERRGKPRRSSQKLA